MEKKQMCSPAQFEAIYFANLAAPDRPSAHTAYIRAEATVMLSYGDRKYKNYESFKNNLSKLRRRSKAALEQPDKREAMAGILRTVNVYLGSIDLPTLTKYQKELADQARNMEAFGPANGTYDAAELKKIKSMATAMDALLKYIQSVQ